MQTFFSPFFSCFKHSLWCFPVFLPIIITLYASNELVLGINVVYVRPIIIIIIIFTLKFLIIKLPLHTIIVCEKIIFFQAISNIMDLIIITNTVSSNSGKIDQFYFCYFNSLALVMRKGSE